MTKITIEPRKTFLIDGMGALLSSFLLGVVLVRFEDLFGIPVNTLYFLAILPIFFAIFDFYTFFSPPKHLSSPLNVIAYVNLAYCVISLGLAGFHHDRLTALGWGYILVEIAIVAALAVYELRLARRL